jgi:hypothetical protein
MEVGVCMDKVIKDVQYVLYHTAGIRDLVFSLNESN